MNVKHLYVAIVAVLGTLAVSCSKEEMFNEKPVQTAQGPGFVYEDLILKYSQMNGPAGVDATGGLNYPKAVHLQFPYGPDEELPEYPFEQIKSPTNSYLKETCLFDVSQLENNKTYHKLQNGSLRMAFFTPGFEELRMLKLPSSSESGWNAHWANPPAVESEKPDVFVTWLYRMDSFVIYLSKPVTEFGFEIAPNNKAGKHTFSAYYGDWLRQSTKGYVEVEASSPSGAGLVAIKASEPFRMIIVYNTDHPKEPDAQGVAIANIRYRLAGK